MRRRFAHFFASLLAFYLCGAFIFADSQWLGLVWSWTGFGRFLFLVVAYAFVVAGRVVEESSS